jgi:hypothetical protein
VSSSGPTPVGACQPQKLGLGIYSFQFHSFPKQPGQGMDIESPVRHLSGAIAMLSAYNEALFQLFA